MPLYQKTDKKVRDILPFFPAVMLSSEYKDMGYTEKGSYTALTKDRYVQYNSPDRISVIAVDIDTNRDGGAWLDYDLPEPSWTIWTTRGVQMAWVLNKPILARVAEHKKMAKEVLAKIVYALDGDIHAMRFNRVFRNPFNNPSRITNTKVDLKDFFHLPTPDQAWWDRVKAKSTKKKSKVFSVAEDPVELEELGELRNGDGRNEALFYKLRHYAYSLENYNEFALAEEAYKLNRQLLEALNQRELEGIVRSINKFMTTQYTGKRGTGMTANQLKERASRAGRKSGKSRKAKSNTKINITIKQMQSFDIKITVSEIARRAKVKRDRAREYLIEKGWKEVSRKVGWKQQINIDDIPIS